MRSSQWPGPHLATSLPPAAEIRVCGFGKVSPGPSRSSWAFTDRIQGHIRCCDPDGVISWTPFLFPPAVDEEDEYECVSVLNSHTQDVKHVVWHPSQEVRVSWRILVGRTSGVEAVPRPLLFRLGLAVTGITVCDQRRDSSLGLACPNREKYWDDRHFLGHKWFPYVPSC